MNKRRTILLIDDSDYIIDGTASLLRFEGYTVLTATNGKDGLMLAKQYHPDLIICDVSMPEMDGYTVLRHIREDPETASLRFMFLTARAEKSDMRAGMDIGADDYLVKPFSIEELLSAIEAQWKKSAVLQRGIEEIKLNVTYALPHEFRTVLNQILGAAQTLKQMDYDRTTTVELANDIITSAQRLLSLTENFLVYAQLETLSADHRAVEQLCSYRTEEAAAMAADIAQTVAQYYDRVNDLILANVPEGVTIRMSSENFRKVLYELISNAFKFSRAGTKVIVHCTVSNNNGIFVIRDQGTGMTTAQINQIGAYKQFNRFIQEQQGVGLGLIIAKRMVELHGGEFSIESAIGEGTTVRFCIPTV
ncbi:MAG: response regulator [Candidatus Kapabacteria bacterium]|nr:response regulator [Candidatus Kapabacteria bacterium]